jgi:hypothetical protein
MAQIPTVLAADTLTGDKVVNPQKEDLGNRPKNWRMCTD